MVSKILFVETFQLRPEWQGSRYTTIGLNNIPEEDIVGKTVSGRNKKALFLTGVHKRESFMNIWKLQGNKRKQLLREQTIDRIRFRYEATIDIIREF